MGPAPATCGMRQNCGRCLAHGTVRSPVTPTRRGAPVLIGVRMDPTKLRALLARVASGDLNVEGAMKDLSDLPFTDLGYAMVDHHRALRQGVPEVIFGEGKTADQIIGIASS